MLSLLLFILFLLPSDWSYDLFNASIEPLQWIALVFSVLISKRIRLLVLVFIAYRASRNQFVKFVDFKNQRIDFFNKDSQQRTELSDDERLIDS